MSGTKLALKHLKEELMERYLKKVNEAYMPEDIETGFLMAKEMAEEFFDELIGE